MTIKRRRIGLVAWVILLLLAGAKPVVAAETALDWYVAAPDASFDWSLALTIPGAGYTAHILDMTSQTWRSPAEVDRTEWQHRLTVVVPDGSPTDTALLLIDGGSNSGSPLVDVTPELALAAVATNSVVVQLPTVPNQPLRFSGEAHSRSEDALLAYSFDRFLATGDETWPALLPMVNSAVRAMDVVQDFVPTQTQGTVDVNSFIVAGASKRGWTTWLTAAVDSRISAIVPIVFDALNLDQQMAHHKAAYEGVTDQIVGGYSEAIADYVEFGIPDRLDTPEGQALLQIVDPYEYRNRLDMPKYQINATGDEFFVPDSAQFYFHDLPGENYLRYVPNTGHGFSDAAATDVLLGTLSFYNAVTQGAELPEFSWAVEDQGRTIRLSTVDAPLEVTLWQATNPDARDFRYFGGSGPVWTGSTLTDSGGGQYVGQVPFPATGATAFMIEMRYDNGADFPYIFTTEVRVVRPIPEPSAMVLAAVGLLAALACGYNRR